jgi:hypothetical protein
MFTSHHLFSLDFLIFLVGVGLIIFYFYSRYGNSVTMKSVEGSNGSPLVKKILKPLLSAKERLELSWKFLYEITEIVISKFSNQDKQEIINSGSILFNAGMRYEHVVDYAVNHESQKIYEQKLATSKEGEVIAAGQSR